MPGSKGPTLNGSQMHAPLAWLLRPLVRLLIRSGITFPALADILRELYVNVAEHDFVLPDKAQTDSRVSLLTGIHRKEVSRLRGAGAPVNAVPATVSRTSLILAHWLASKDFTGPDGHPLPLPRTAEEPAPSFEKLVEAVTRDVRPRAILDEWLDRGLVVHDAEDRLVIAETAFTPQPGSERQLYYLGRNLHDHIAAAVANVEGNSPRFLERAMHYDGLSQVLAEQLEERSRGLAMEALLTANREAHEACQTDEPGDWRINFGIYVYAEQVTDRRSSEPGARAADGEAGPPEGRDDGGASS
ncbi:DUF6502 family protein [Kaistia dalseonensis]|uniref:Uncharacterized protein n=1 Tax=Kaistia dalseonensis TaxID=410840 RepID=A0ABU0HD95_9HYPH|nr:DUF6502 family protein [Kaistia dalseonensis]MCX5497182.1 DUF6502 family protein [Kaistia dalseonensis]MDQ0439813.1 hypothetical protein [Kaistia dalseonensis]